MLKKILLALILVVATVARADDDLKTAASKAYVDTSVETLQDKIPAANTPGVGAGETVMTYTSTGNGQIGERGIYTGANGYDASTDAEKLITASALNDTFTNLPTTGTTKLECANLNDGCTLWTIVDQTAYGRVTITNDKNIAPDDFTGYGVAEIIAHTSRYSYDFSFSPVSSEGWYGLLKGDIPVTAGHKYYIRAEMSSSTPAILAFSFNTGVEPAATNRAKANVTPNEMYLVHGIVTATTTTNVVMYLRCGYAEVGGPYTGKAHNIGMFDLTEIFGAGNEPTTPEAAQAALIF